MPCAARANLLICWKPTLPGSALPQMKAAARAALAAPITRASAALSMKNITKSWCAKGWFTPAFAAAASCTPRQLWLYRELGLPAPEFYHMPLLLAVDGRRLSKRDGDESLEHLQARYTPEQIIGRLAYACGLQNAPDPRTPAELADGFSWQRVPQNDIILPEGLF